MLEHFPAYRHFDIRICKYRNVVKTVEIYEMEKKELDGLAAILRIIAHPDRLRILCFLKNGRKNVTELEELLGDNQSFVSQQLRLLRLNELVVSEKENGFVYYDIVPEKKKHIENILKDVCGMCRV